MLKIQKHETMKVKLTKTSVALIAQMLTITKQNNPDALTPMAMVVNDVTNHGKACNTAEVKEQYLRVARYLGWSVSKRKGQVFENGRAIWDA